MNASKMINRSASSVRLAVLKIELCSRVSWLRSARSVYFGRGARVRVTEGDRFEAGTGFFLSEDYLLQMNSGARTVLGEGVFTNVNACAEAAESAVVDNHTILGPNTCKFDHNHFFGECGAPGDFVMLAVEIDVPYLIGTNLLYVRKARIVDRFRVRGNCHTLPRRGGCLPVHPRMARQVLCRIGRGCD